MLLLVEKAAPDARVITVSSGGMYTAPLTTDLQVTVFLNISAASFCLSSTNGVSNELFQCDSNFNGVDQYARNKRVQVS